MAANLTAAQPMPNLLQAHSAGTGYVISAQVGATEAIVRGTFVTLDTSDKFLGVHTVPDAIYGISLQDITGGASNGDVTCEVLCEAVFQYALASVAVADIGKAVFSTFNHVLTLTGEGTNSPVGRLVGVPATGTAIVKLWPPRVELVDWVITNRTADLTIDCNATVAVIGDGLGTLIEALIDEGVLNGTVA